MEVRLHGVTSTSTLYARNCSCGRLVFYKRKTTFEKALRNNSLCPSCRTAQNNKSLKRDVKKENNPSWRGFKDIPGKVFSKLRRDAKTRDIGFFITLEDISNVFESQNKLCALSGCPISFLENTASVDRINSNKDYIVENIQIVHKHINMMKRDFDNDYFIATCKLIADKYR